MYTDNEPGPRCMCGTRMTVKADGQGGFMLLCLFHSEEAGAGLPLPPDRPRDLNEYFYREVSKAWNGFYSATELRKIAEDNKPKGSDD